MAHLFKPTYTKVDPETGQRSSHSLRKWYAEFHDADGTRRRVALCEDRAAAQAMLADIIRNVERQIAGIIDPSTGYLKKPVKDTLEEYRRHLEGKARSEKHVSETIRLITRVLNEAQCKLLGDLQSAADALERSLTARLEDGVSHRTVNADLIAVRSFCRWLVAKKRILIDPTIGLEHLNVEADRRHERRALTEAEARQLISVTDDSKREFRKLTGHDRAVMYMLAQRTGLRRKELLSLSPESFDFTVSPAIVTIKAADSKRRKRDVLPLPTDVADAVQEYLRDRTPAMPLWSGSWWRRSAEMMQLDLRDAGIEPVDADGQVIDFHGQRTTFITSLARAGVSPATAQRLARHSDINLTMGVYTRLKIEDLNDAVQTLPTLRPPGAANDANPNPSPNAETRVEELDEELERVKLAWAGLRRSVNQAILALLAED